MEEAKKMITEEQLKTVSDQQSKLSALLRNIGVVEVQKQNIHSIGRYLSPRSPTRRGGRTVGRGGWMG